MNWSERDDSGGVLRSNQEQPSFKPDCSNCCDFIIFGHPRFGGLSVIGFGCPYPTQAAASHMHEVGRMHMQWKRWC
jgi:hypothetical protein